MIKMLVRLAVSAMMMVCAFDAFGADLRYTTDKTLVCIEVETITYFKDLITQGDGDAALKFVRVLLENEKCVISKPGIPVYVMGSGSGVVTIRMKGEFVPFYTLKSSLTSTAPKTKGSTPDIKVPETRDF